MQEAMQSPLSTPGGDPTESSTVLIVDDHRLFAEAITWALEQMGMQVVLASSGEEALKETRRHRPALVLLDIGLPGTSGLAVGRDILRIAPSTKVVAVTALQDPGTVRDAVRLGFHGYLTKDIPIERFTTSIKAAIGGQMVIPHNLARVVGGAQSEDERQAMALATQLTTRERDVLAMLVEGASSAAIARILSISPNTVRSHIQNILPKLQVHSRLEAAAYAMRYGLVEAHRNGN
jgi:two-component system, NarL family, nitrate/nitrite response regulator NarL